MKKVLFLVLLMILALGCTTAFAGCSEHPDAADYYDNIYPVFVNWNDNIHKIQSIVYTYCEACDAYIRTDVYEVLDYHTFIDGVCWDCGFSYEGIGRNSTPEILQREALDRIIKDPDDIIGKAAQVIHKGSLYADVASSFILGAVNTGDEYGIVDYAVDGDEVWLAVKYDAGTAWVSAGLVRISGANALSGESADLYTGRSCTIKVSSGRARVAPDKDSAVVEYVGYGERYTILACESAPDGTLWFQIRIGSSECWISSGLADVK